MKFAKPLVLLFLILAAGLAIYHLFFPPAEKVIRKNLVKLAEAVSAQPQGNIATVANVNYITSFFHPDVNIQVEQLGREVSNIQGVGELQQMAMGARQNVRGLRLKFQNVEVLPDDTRTNATVYATAVVDLNRDGQPIVQDLQMHFEKSKKEWLIRSATPRRSVLEVN